MKSPKSSVESLAEASPMDRYKIRARANTPRKMFLFDPATNKETTDYLEIYSSLSDSFRAARDASMQAVSKLVLEKDVKTRAALIAEGQLKLYASLVAGWSFPTPCTQEAVAEFLKEAPQVQNMVVAEADDTESFFGCASTA